MDNNLKHFLMPDEPTNDRGEIELRIVQWGERTYRVDLEEFKKAVTDGELDALLDVEVSDMDPHTAVITPTGALIPLYSIRESPRRTVLGHGTSALADIITQARPDCIGCVYCGEHQACSRHIAEHVMEAIRLEQLTLVHVDPGANPWRNDGDG